jgi:hypothetical protein
VKQRSRSHIWSNVNIHAVLAVFGMQLRKIPRDFFEKKISANFFLLEFMLVNLVCHWCHCVIGAEDDFRDDVPNSYGSPGQTNGC